MKRYGLTLFEFLVVLVVIGVLVGLVLPAIKKVQDAAQAAKQRQNIEQQEPKYMPYLDD